MILSREIKLDVLITTQV